MASSQSLENENDKLLFIIFSLTVSKILKLIVLYSCFRSVRMSDLERAIKAGVLNECSYLHKRESLGKNLFSDPFN